MHLAPLASALNSMLAGLPFAFAQVLDPGTAHQQVQRPIGAAIRDLNLQGLLSPAQGRIVRDGPVQPGSRGGRLATILAVCLRGSLNSTLIDRQTWIAASEKTGGRPDRPSYGAFPVISLLSQIGSEPRFLGAAL